MIFSRSSAVAACLNPLPDGEGAKGLQVAGKAALRRPDGGRGRDGGPADRQIAPAALDSLGGRQGAARDHLQR
eukprot:3075108-Prymnesium_polylepis.1